MSSNDPARHPIRDGIVTAVIVSAEALATVQGELPHLFPTPTLPSGRPLVTQEERDLADHKKKLDEDRQFDFTRPVPRPEQVEQRFHDSRPER
ncbi:hypothetical protein AB0B66_41730 [Catellatospora sp. NPDC049111]|uniref:hypothetical protein n=1 Tax=Catellatospora sp. NPDC049111 TaxID=3155271 RepID=UPI0033E11117